ncbi:hypothetical protein LVJ61_25765, partial [Klebsiella pneumoniae]|uniref:hypothetical protein n=1 Tax=Klebsiella pneumoniae TaxID=573 RepID=UPI001C68A94C
SQSRKRHSRRRGKRFSASLCHRFFPFFLDVFEKKTGGAVFLRLPPEFYPSPHPLGLKMGKVIISR